MNKKIIIVAILILAISLSGCTTEMATYTQEDKDGEMVLYADQSFVVFQTNEFAGTWRIRNDGLHLHAYSGVVYILSPDGKDYCDVDGDHWIKK